MKTNSVINECLGGVLFIDEAYALGNSEKRDSFAKECIDTLCEGLSNHKEELMVIIAGYEKELKDCFFLIIRDWTLVSIGDLKRTIMIILNYMEFSRKRLMK